MALVDYTSSDEDEAHNKTEAEVNAGLKCKREDENSSELPPLPSKFHDLYASSIRVSTRDDPNLHGGRKRATPHIEGSWPTHLYVEYHETLSRVLSKLRDVIPEKSEKLHSSLTSDLDVSLPLHISLSRPIALPTEQKDVFQSVLEQGIKASRIRPFEVSFSNLDWVPNFDRTRWFLVLRLTVPNENGLNKLLYICNKTVQEFGQPPLYAQTLVRTKSDKSKIPTKYKDTLGRRASDFKIDWDGIQDVSNAFHISIAWTLEPPNTDLLDATNSMAGILLEDVKKFVIKIEEIKAKVGNVVTNIPLKKNASEEKGLFGF